MKRFLSAVLAVALAAGAWPVNTFDGSTNNNWNVADNWSDAHVPTDGEAVSVATYTVVIDVTRIPATGTLASLTSTSGRCTIALNTVGSVEIYSTVYGSSTALSSGVALITTSGTTGNSLTLVGNGTGANLSSGSNGYMVRVGSTGPHNFVGSVTGGPTNACHAIYMTSVSSSGLSFTGNLSGGGVGSRGLYIDTGTTVTVDLNGNSVVGSSTAGSTTGSGIYSVVGYTLVDANLINGTVAVAMYGTPPTTFTNTGNAHYVVISSGGLNYVGAVTADKLATGTVQGTVTGTLDGEAHTADEVLTTASSPGNVVLPGADTVLAPTAFGPEGAYTGTYVCSGGAVFFNPLRGGPVR